MAKKKSTEKSTKQTVHRSAQTGKFVTKEYADKHPKTTIKDSVNKKGGGTDHTGPRRK